MMNENPKGKILIVDDDDFLVEMYTNKFQKDGFDVVAAKDGEDALTKIKGMDKFDIIMFDLIMPIKDGEELITEIRDQNLIPDALKIVLTNQGEKEDIETIEKIGVDSYIIKAIHTPSDVLKLVNDLYNKK